MQRARAAHRRVPEQCQQRAADTATQALLPQLRTEYEAAAALCRKVGLQSCKELREAKEAFWVNKGLTVADLALLGTLESVLPALLCER